MPIFTSSPEDRAFEQLNEYVALKCSKGVLQAKLPGLKNLILWKRSLSSGIWTGERRKEASRTGLSQSTVRRAIRDLTQAGFLTVVERQRKNGADSSNLYVLNSFLY